MTSQTPPTRPPGARELLRQRSYMAFWTSRWLGSLAAQAQAVTIAWQIYQIARATDNQASTRPGSVSPPAESPTARTAA